jgi:hypothetical protein
MSRRVDGDRGGVFGAGWRWIERRGHGVYPGFEAVLGTCDVPVRIKISGSTTATLADGSRSVKTGVDDVVPLFAYVRNTDPEFPPVSRSGCQRQFVP